MIRFFEDIKEKRINEQISENQYLMITTSRLAKSILGDITQNDINAYTDRTSAEIIDIIEQEHKDEIEKVQLDGANKIKREQERSLQEIEHLTKQHNEEITEKTNKIEYLEGQIGHVDNYCKRMAGMISNAVMIVISILLFVGFFAKRYLPTSFWELHPSVSLCWYIIDGILSLWAFFNWIGIIWKFADLKQYLYRKVYIYFRRRVMKDNVL